MPFRNLPIQRKLMTVILLVSGIVTLVACASFFVYDYYTFRQTSFQKTALLGEIISNNSTAALAFDNAQDAREILSALKADPHIVLASLYNKEGILFAQYSAQYSVLGFPTKPAADGYRFVNAAIEGFEPVMIGDNRVGTLYLKSDITGMYERFARYGLVILLVMVLSFISAYLLSRVFQKNISIPILNLAQMAKAVSDQNDYSVRAVKMGNDELGLLTDAFNRMLTRIQEQNNTLSEFNQTLEHRVRERTIELETANKEIESFSYSVSHDLRAPLRAINGYSRILMDEHEVKFDEETMRLLQMIQSNGKRMGVLIDDLLAFSRLGRKEIIKDKVDFNQLIDKALRNLGETMGRVKISVQHLKSSTGDAALLYQVFENLISNAIKYSGKKKSPEVSIGFYENEKEYIYYVRDNGIGFNMEYAHKLFGVFQRLHSYEEFEGTGVGLAIVQRVIVKHGGRIWAEAEIDKGATFYFSLPKPEVASEKKYLRKTT